MDTPTLVTLLVIVFIFSAIFIRSRNSKPSIECTYEAKSTLLTPAERSFYGVLCQALDRDRYAIFAQVRLADVISPAKGTSKSDWQRAFNQISSKHCDFVICDADTMKIQLAIELDDSSHKKDKRASRDEFVNAIFKQASLPLIRVTASKAYVVGALRAELMNIMDPSPVEVDQSSSVATLGNPDSTSTSPLCPKCRGKMQLRTVTKGKKAGTQFWGCSTFPKCRGVIAIESIEGAKVAE